MRKNKKQRRIMFLLILILGITIGFALLSTTLYINGTAAIKSNTWNIHWDDTSVNVTQGSVSASAPSVTTATSTKDTVSFDVEFEMPGDFYEFEKDAINEGSVDGALQLSNNWITYKSNNVATTLPSYMDFKVTYDDGTTVPANGDVLEHGESKTYKIRVEFKSSVEELPEEAEPITIEVNLPYVQHKEEDSCSTPVSFSTDSWETIACNVRKGNTNAYNIGDTKEVTINNFGTHIVRVANKSTPSECSTQGFSQSACGFVVEFSDIIIHNAMNPYDNYGDTDGDGNKGGWEHCQVRGFLNHYLNNLLPSDLNNVIINTTVVSGHGNHDTDNFTTTDLLYLLSTKEVYGEDPSNYDTASEFSRQLDYYSSANVTMNNYSAVMKTDNTVSDYTTGQWWLRSPYKELSGIFSNVERLGSYNTGVSSSVNNGVSPAFRIG